MAKRMDDEKTIQRNPHPDFKSVEGSRQNWASLEWNLTKTADPDWKFGQGATDGGKSLEKNHIEIDPYEEGRMLNDFCFGKGRCSADYRSSSFKLQAAHLWNHSTSNWFHQYKIERWYVGSYVEAEELRGSQGVRPTSLP